MAVERMPKEGGKTVPVEPKAGARKNRGAEKVSKTVKKTEVKKVREKVSTGVKDKKSKPVDKSKAKKKSPNNGRRGRIDWIAARNDYTTDASMSYAKIAEKYGCAKRSVEQRAKKESWVKVRQSVGEIINDEVAKLTAQSADEANQRHRSIWSEAQELVLTRLRRIREDADKGFEVQADGKIVGMFNPKEMKAIIESLKITVEGERTAIGLPNSVIRNQNENKDVDDFADLDDAELDELINAKEVEPNEHNTATPQAANSTPEGEDRTAPTPKS